MSSSSSAIEVRGGADKGTYIIAKLFRYRLRANSLVCRDVSGTFCRPWQVLQAMFEQIGDEGSRRFVMLHFLGGKITHRLQPPNI